MDIIEFFFVYLLYLVSFALGLRNPIYTLFVVLLLSHSELHIFLFLLMRLLLFFFFSYLFFLFNFLHNFLFLILRFLNFLLLNNNFPLVLLFTRLIQFERLIVDLRCPIHFLRFDWALLNLLDLQTLSLLSLFHHSQLSIILLYFNHLNLLLLLLLPYFSCHIEWFLCLLNPNKIIL